MIPKFNNKRDTSSKVKKNKIDDQINAHMAKAGKHLKDRNHDGAIKNYKKALDYIVSKYNTIHTDINPSTLSQEDQAPFFKATLKLALIYASRSYKSSNKENSQLFITICSKSNMPDMHYQLGKIYLSTEFTLTNIEKAKYHLSIAANHGHNEAKQYLIQMQNEKRNSIYQIKPDKTDEQKSDFDSGSITSQKTSSLQSTSNRTSLVDINAKETKWMEQYKDSIKADAERGDNDSQFTLGYMYENGIGFKRNLSDAKTCKALEWYKYAAQKDCIQAQYNLGSLYAQGLGTSTSRDHAFHWYTRAADKGHHEAQANAGYFYFEQCEFEKAKMYYNQAAMGGVKSAHLTLEWLDSNA